MFDEDKYIIEDDYKKKIYEVLKKEKKIDDLDIYKLRFLKDLLVYAQGFSYKAYDDDLTNSINLYSFLAYTLVKHINDDNNGNNDKSYLNTLEKLFRKNINIEISQELLMQLFEFLSKIKISDSLKDYLYYVCYINNIKHNCVYVNENLNIDSCENKYYTDEMRNLENIINKYNINFYNYDMTNKLNLNKTNLSSEFDENIENLIINNYENKGKKK